MVADAPLRQTGRGDPPTIIVALDGSPASRQALLWAVAEAHLRQARLRTIYAWQPETSADGWVAGGFVDGKLPGIDEQRHGAERRLTAMLADAGVELGAIEPCVVAGDPVEVLVSQSRQAQLLVVGTRGHGAAASVLLGSVSRGCAQHAHCPVVVVRGLRAHSEPRPWRPEEVIARETAQNTRTWEMLARLGVEEGTPLVLEFLYETSGPVSDSLLAEYLRGREGYRVDVEPDGVTGQTAPLPVSPATLDAWVTEMVLAGHEHGGCAFDGWTADLSAPLHAPPG
jgi:nucleotide-binding universal stress UspA family protein